MGFVPAAGAQGQRSSGEPTLLAQRRPTGSQPQPSTTLQLRVRRLPDTIELVIEGAGQGPQLQQRGDETEWQGLLSTAMPAALRAGPQRLSLPEVGLRRIEFDEAEGRFALTVRPMSGVRLSRPTVSGDGRDLIISFPSPVPQASLQTNRVNVIQPGAVPLPTYAPPLQPRAVAPPLGDMAVGTMVIRNPGFVNLSGPPVTMTLRNAPAKEALMTLAQLGGYGFAYVADPGPQRSGQAEGGDPGMQPVTLTFRGESFAQAFNTTLLASGLQGKREGNTILAGPTALSKTFGPQVSKVYRLNQVGANAAADYLANLGASVTKTNTITTSVTQGAALAETISGGTATQTTQTQQITSVEAFGASSGPLLGLRATTDTRLSTITLFGDPAVVGIAEQYLKKLDLRQRQVALSVQILDVNLDNASEIDTSFAVRLGNNFIINNSGELVAQFGRDQPTPPTGSITTTTETITGSGADTRSSTVVGSEQISISSDDQFRNLTDSDVQKIITSVNASVEGTATFNPQTRTFDFLFPVPGPAIAATSAIDAQDLDTISNITRIIDNEIKRNTGLESRLTTTVLRDSLASQFADSQTRTTVRDTTTELTGARDPSTFVQFLRAQIISGSTKLLASPTLILQENPSLLREGGEGSFQGTGSNNDQGVSNIALNAPIGRRRANEGVVRVGTNVVTGYRTESPREGGNIVCTPELSTAGLVLGARVEKIDDNGFVSFVLSPNVSAPVGRERAPDGCGSDLNILNVRSLDTGILRVRDGQTLVMTGVISENDRRIVSKWPILGDLPLIGQFFRATSGSREKRELIILVTPRIISDDDGGTFGYGYRPGTAAGRNFLGSPSGSGWLN